MITERGLKHAPLSADFMAMMEGAEGKAAVSGKHILRLLKQIKPIFSQFLRESWQAAQDADALIYHPKAISGPHSAEKRGIARFLAHPVPLFAATRAFPHPALPFANLGPLLNRWSHAPNKAADGPFGVLVKQWRTELGLPATPTTTRPALQVYGYSPHVIPTPADWDDSVTATGYWFLDHPAHWQPDPELVQFLAHGPAPVYIGFGRSHLKNSGGTKSRYSLSGRSHRNSLRSTHSEQSIAGNVAARQTVARFSNVSDSAEVADHPACLASCDCGDVARSSQSHHGPAQYRVDRYRRLYLQSDVRGALGQNTRRESVQQG